VLLPHADSTTASVRMKAPLLTPRQSTRRPRKRRDYGSNVSAADERLERYARLVVEVGVNLQPGQTLAVGAGLEHAPLVRAVAREAYRL
jgi:hypothetical protein